ncbi:MAG: hypothetical protein P4L82_02745 [Ancalomicrobiaceae bacterium]|nr:hypothetical protein [Ancalomicrobiaceae bacterium]
MQSEFRLAVLSILALILTLSSADAGPVLDRVRSRGVVHCGSYERPGIANDVGEAEAAVADSAGQEPTTTPWHGLAVDLCRAVADAVLGSPDKIAFHSYEGGEDVEALTNGDDDIAFLTATEMHATAMTGKVVPGPAIFVESINVMLPASDAARGLADLDGNKGICVAAGSTAERVVAAYYGASKRSWLPHPYTEDGEMLDAYNVQACHALAGERTWLAMQALEGGVNSLKSTILPDALVAYPIMATTGSNDGVWASIVAWTVYTLEAGDRPSTDWTVGGVAAMPVPFTAEGLAVDWQTRLIKQFGSYGAVIERDLGAKSALRLPAGLNRGPEHQGALIAPFLE